MGAKKKQISPLRCEMTNLKIIGNAKRPGFEYIDIRSAQTSHLFFTIHRTVNGIRLVLLKTRMIFP